MQPQRLCPRSVIAPGPKPSSVQGFNRRDGVATIHQSAATCTSAGVCTCSGLTAAVPLSPCLSSRTGECPTDAESRAKSEFIGRHVFALFLCRWWCYVRQVLENVARVNGKLDVLGLDFSGQHREGNISPIDSSPPVYHLSGTGVE